MLLPELDEVLDPEPHSASFNMALDEVLLRTAERPTLRVYRWAEPSVSFGYFGKLSTAKAAGAGRPVVRRWTGGGIVEHGEDLTYSLVVPCGHAFLRHRASDSYRLIHEVIAGLLAGEGMAAETVAAASASVSGECFASPVQYDLAVNKVKIAGAAQRRTRWGLLHQGSVHAGELGTGLRGKFATAFCAAPISESLAAELRDAALVLAEEKYGTAKWLQKF